MVLMTAENQVTNIRKNTRNTNTTPNPPFPSCFAGGKPLDPPALPVAFPKLRQDAVLLKIPAPLPPCLFFPVISQRCFWQMEMTPTKRQVHALAASLLKGI